MVDRAVRLSFFDTVGVRIPMPYLLDRFYYSAACKKDIHSIFFISQPQNDCTRFFYYSSAFKRLFYGCLKILRAD
jgi:hypothetical protein